MSLYIYLWVEPCVRDPMGEALVCGALWIGEVRLVDAQEMPVCVCACMCVYVCVCLLVCVRVRMCVRMCVKIINVCILDSISTMSVSLSASPFISTLFH